MPEDLIKLLYLIVFSLIFALIIVVPVILWRAIRGKPLLNPRKKVKFKSLIIFYLAIFFSIALSIVAFFKNMPFHALFLLIVTALYLIGLFAYKKGWRG